MPSSLPTPQSSSSSKTRVYEDNQRHARKFSESPRYAGDELAPSRFRRYEAEESLYSPVLGGSSKAPNSKPGSSSTRRDDLRISKPKANEAHVSFGKARHKLAAVSRFRFLGRREGPESHLRDDPTMENEVLVSPRSTRMANPPVTTEEARYYKLPTHARFSSAPNVVTHDVSDRYEHERNLTPKKPPSGNAYHDRTPPVQHNPWPVPATARSDLDERAQRYGEDSNRSTPASRAEDASKPVTTTSRMGRFGIYASPSPSVIGSPVSSPAPNQRWMPASPRPVDAGKSASPTPPTSPLRSPFKPPTHSLAAALTKTPKSQQSNRLSDSQYADGSRSDPKAETSVETFPMPRARRRPLKEEELFAMKLANRMSAFIPQTPRSVASPRPRIDDGMPPIVEFNSLNSMDEDNDDSGTEEDTTPKALAQNKPLLPGQVDDPQPREEPTSTEVKKPEAQGKTTLSSFLSSARDMNDNFVKSTSSAWDRLFYRGTSGSSNGKGKKKESEQLTPKPSVTNIPTTAAPTPDDVFSERNSKDDLEGSRDIMLYSPLIPASDSIVELGRSEVVTLYSQSGDEEREREDRAYRAELRRRWADGRGFVSFEALAREQDSSTRTDGDYNGGMMQERARTMSNALQIDLGDDSGSSSASETAVEKDSASGSPNPGPSLSPTPRERVIWRPSPTQLSVQVLWWGYRMYLPPPVLATLNAHSTSLTKRAALLTSALTWLLNNLPLTLLPPILAPAALLLRALVPLLGAIGTFISWSWRAIVMFDNGKGVVLSATWLLPVVLVPGTWDDVVEAEDEAASAAGRGGQGQREPATDFTTGGVQAFTSAVPRAGPSGLRTRRENTL